MDKETNIIKTAQRCYREKVQYDILQIYRSIQEKLKSLSSQSNVIQAQIEQLRSRWQRLQMMHYDKKQMRVLEQCYNAALSAERRELPPAPQLRAPMEVAAFTIYSDVNGIVKNNLTKLVDPQVNVHQNTCLLNNAQSLQKLYQLFNQAKVQKDIVEKQNKVMDNIWALEAYADQLDARIQEYIG